MSYIRAQKVDIEVGAVSRDGAVHLELPDHDEAGSEITLDMNMVDENMSDNMMTNDMNTTDNATTNY